MPLPAPLSFLQAAQCPRGPGQARRPAWEGGAVAGKDELDHGLSPSGLWPKKLKNREPRKTSFADEDTGPVRGGGSFQSQGKLQEEAAWGDGPHPCRTFQHPF